MNTRPLRLWPALTLAAIMIVGFVLAPLLVPEGGMYGLLVAVASGAAIILWWLFFSRASWTDRVGALALMVVAMLAVRPLLHPSIAGAGMGRLFYIFAIPIFGLVLASAAAASRRLSVTARRTVLAAGVIAGASLFLLLRTDGVKGGSLGEFHWRWTPTAEQRLLAQTRDEPLPAPPAAPNTPEVSQPAAASPETKDAPGPAAAAKIEAALPPVRWAGFRGTRRDGVVRGVRIDTDWSRSAPAPMWRRPIGPGWSSFAVAGDLIYTQEQRGDDEIVAAYSFTSGKPVWMHRERARFYESNAGPGPRATPTVSGGRVYALGATGILTALDAATGAKLWSRNAAIDTEKKLPGWGFAGSPIVVDDLVVVAASGRLAAYGTANGMPRWIGPNNGGGYSSPQLVTIDGVEQIVHMSGTGTAGFAPADGKVLWTHPWEGTPMVQPSLLPDGDLLITTADMMSGIGVRRLAIKQGSNGWTVEERWTSRGLKPYFNDYVVHEGHAYGFDGNILSCVDLTDGARKWKGGRYGNGQMIVLSDQDLLLVISEDGELALVNAAPDKFTEIARVPALNAKTWNHPVVVDDVLLIRNGEEMAAYKLARR